MLYMDPSQDIFGTVNSWSMGRCYCIQQTSDEHSCLAKSLNITQHEKYCNGKKRRAQVVTCFTFTFHPHLNLHDLRLFLTLGRLLRAAVFVDLWRPTDSAADELSLARYCLQSLAGVDHSTMASAYHYCKVHPITNLHSQCENWQTYY